MTLQTSGAITLAQIQTEFGGSNPISMNEYYAGGSYVPTGTSGTNGAVPTSGQISFSQFYGTSDYLDYIAFTTGNSDSSVYYGDPIGDYDTYFVHFVDGTLPSSPLFTNAVWHAFQWTYSYGVFTNQLGMFEIQIKRPLASGAFTNSGWNTITINSSQVGQTVINRTSMGFSTTNDSTYYYANWAIGGTSQFDDPFNGGTFNPSPATGTIIFT